MVVARTPFNARATISVHSSIALGTQQRHKKVMRVHRVVRSFCTRNIWIDKFKITINHHFLQLLYPATTTIDDDRSIDQEIMFNFFPRIRHNSSQTLRLLNLVLPCECPLVNSSQVLTSDTCSPGQHILGMIQTRMGYPSENAHVRTNERSIE